MEHVKLVETHADHRLGPSADLAAACREGWRPATSWLVTKEDGSQAIVVMLWRRAAGPDADAGELLGWPDRRGPRPEPDPPRGLRLDGGPLFAAFGPVGLAFALVAAISAAACATIWLVLS